MVKVYVTFPHQLAFVSDTNVLLLSSLSASPLLVILLLLLFCERVFARVCLYLFAVWIFCFKCNMSVGIVAEKRFCRIHCFIFFGSFYIEIQTNGYKHIRSFYANVIQTHTQF